MHRFGNTIATTYFGHKGSRKTDNKLPALLYSTVHPDPLLTQDLWGDLEWQEGREKKKERQKNNQSKFSLRVPWSSSWLGAATCYCSWSKVVLYQQLLSGHFPSPTVHVHLSIWSDNCRSASPQTNNLNPHVPKERTLSTTTESNADHSAFPPLFSDLALNPLCYCTSVRC